MTNSLKRLAAEEILDHYHIARLLGYQHTSNSAEETVSPRGYRVLNKIPRLPAVIIHNLVEKFGRLPHLMMATIDELDEVDGIGEVRARTIKEGLRRIQDQVLIDRHI
jgi:diadenylate cyclase